MFVQPKALLDRLPRWRPQPAIMKAKLPFEAVTLRPVHGCHHRWPIVHNLINVDDGLVVQSLHQTCTQLGEVTGCRLCKVPWHRWLIL
jgi:hypothetical protein